MHATRLGRLAFIATAVVIAGACGSATETVGAPAPRIRLTLGSGADAAMPALYPQRDTRYTLDGTLADLGAHAPVRALIAHDVTDADVAHLASVLGMHGTATRTATSYELRDGDAFLSIETGGGSTYLSYSSTTGVGAGSSPGSAGTGSASTGGIATNPSAGAPDAPTEPPSEGPPRTVPLLRPIPKPAIPKPAIPERPISMPPIPEPPIPEPTIPMPTIPPAVDVPDASDATTIAQSLLGDLGVLGDQQWSHAVTDADGVAVSCAADGPCAATPPATVRARTVTYSLLVDGHEVAGTGWAVTIGSHRKVESVSGTWARPDAGTTYPLRSTKLVYDDLTHGRAQYIGPRPMYASDAGNIPPMGAPAVAPDPASTTGATPETVPPLVVHVTGVDLGIARWDGTDNGHAIVYLVPTYRFHATADGGSAYDIEVLALDPASFTVVSPPVTVVPDPGRPEPGGPKTGIVANPGPAPTAMPTVVPSPAPMH